MSKVIAIFCKLEKMDPKDFEKLTGADKSEQNETYSTKVANAICDSVKEAEKFNNLKFANIEEESIDKINWYEKKFGNNFE
jgi:hypothetical protein